MECDDKTFMRGIQGAIDEISKCAHSETGGRLRDFLEHSLRQSRGSVNAFKRLMFEEVNGSSSCMLANFMYAVCHFMEEQAALETGVEDAINALERVYGENPKPSGLIYAFRTLAIANEKSRTLLDAMEKTARLLIELDMKDAGSRAFAYGLRGFVKATKEED
jgi:hypothetical protein